MKPTKAITRTAVAVALLGVLIAAGCAYFNTLYNAKQRFNEAANQPLDREGNVSRSAETMYQEVIDKCHKMIQTWPDSRHVDDARLLIVRSYFGAQDYENAIAAADTLIELQPDTELMDQVLGLKGVALARHGDHEQAVEVLLQRYEKYGPTAEVLSSLCTSLMSLDRSEDAVHYLSILEEKYPNESATFDTEVAIAEILADKEQYEASRGVYERLTADRIPEVFRYRVWTGFARVDIALERYDHALVSLAEVRKLTLTPDEEPPALLLEASAQAGADSVDAAIATYKDIVGRFSRGEFAAEAYYRLGQIYEGMDSLTTAIADYQGVSRAYANSDFAPEALRRANNLTQLMKLQEAADDTSPEAMALRTFSMAELQLFQFEDVDKALAAYEEILDKYPDTEFAPKAAYAVGYIYGVMRSDSTRARDAYRLLMTRYPDSQQAEYANRFLSPAGAAAAADSMRAVTAPADSLLSSPRSTPADSLTFPTVDTVKIPPVRKSPPDTSKTPPDTTRAPRRAKTPPDTTKTPPAQTESEDE